MYKRLTKPLTYLLTLPFAALRLAEKPARTGYWPRTKPKPAAPNVSFGVYTSLTETDQSQQDINHWLAVDGHPLTERWRGGGGGGVVTVGKLVIDGHGSGGGDDYRSGTHAITAGGGQGALQIGVLLLDTPFIRIYPLVGIGGTGGDITLAPLVSNNGSQPHRSGWFALLINGGLGVDVRLSLRWLQVWIGLRLGLHVPTLNVQVGDGEALSVQPRPFFRVLIGTGLKPPTS